MDVVGGGADVAGGAADLRGFYAVDEVRDPQLLMRSLDTTKATPGLRQAQAEMLDALRLDQACRALDIGCGLGGDVWELAERMGPRGHAVGLDASWIMIVEAGRRAADLKARVDFLVGSALAIPFADRAFDACRTEMVFQHLPDPRLLAQEMARTVRPGGRVACLEFDLDLTVLDHPDRRTTRTILHAVTDAAVQGWAGRQLPRRLRQAGFTEIAVAPRILAADYKSFTFVMRRPVAQLVRDGRLTARAAVRWWQELRQVDRDGHYLGGITAFVVSATRP